MKSTKTKALIEFPELTEKVVYRLDASGNKGHCKIVALVQVYLNGMLIAEHKSQKSAYSKAVRFCRRLKARPF